jgi:hypothetical protein
MFSACDRDERGRGKHGAIFLFFLLSFSLSCAIKACQALMAGAFRTERIDLTELLLFVLSFIRPSSAHPPFLCLSQTNL